MSYPLRGSMRMRMATLWHSGHLRTGPIQGSGELLSGVSHTVKSSPSTKLFESSMLIVGNCSVSGLLTYET
jgi:hypothetical protein